MWAVSEWFMRETPPFSGGSSVLEGSQWDYFGTFLFGCIFVLSYVYNAAGKCAVLREIIYVLEIYEHLLLRYKKYFLFGLNGYTYYM